MVRWIYSVPKHLVFATMVTKKNIFSLRPRCWSGSRAGSPTSPGESPGMVLANIQCRSGRTRSPGGHERPSRAGQTILEQRSIIKSGRAGPPNDCPKVPKHEKSLLGFLGGFRPPASVRECCSGHSWALGTSLEAVAADTAAASIHFGPF